MRQVLFWIPLEWVGLPNIPVYGYGAMLFLAFLGCSMLGSRLAKREGIEREYVTDFAIWLFIVGITGARLNYILNEWKTFTSWDQAFAIWDGGLVFHGSFIAGCLFYVYFYYKVLKKNGISQWKFMDVIAPCVALGLALGRVGCLFNGCCYGNVACTSCPAISFPMSAPPRQTFVERGLQTAAGFTLKDATVEFVEPLSRAQDAGLKPGHTIVAIGDKKVRSGDDVYVLLGPMWPRGETEVRLTVLDAAGKTIVLPAFAPVTLGLHPTQVYETISMVLLLLVLLAYYPIKVRDGTVFVGFLFAYGAHRFLNEMLRTDTPPVAFGMTQAQNVSVLLILAGAVLSAIIARLPRSNA